MLASSSSNILFALGPHCVILTNRTLPSAARDGTLNWSRSIFCLARLGLLRLLVHPIAHVAPTAVIGVLYWCCVLYPSPLMGAACPIGTPMHAIIAMRSNQALSPVAALSGFLQSGRCSMTLDGFSSSFGLLLSSHLFKGCLGGFPE